MALCLIVLNDLYMYVKTREYTILRFHNHTFTTVKYLTYFFVYLKSEILLLGATAESWQRYNKHFANDTVVLVQKVNNYM